MAVLTCSKVTDTVAPQFQNVVVGGDGTPLDPIVVYRITLCVHDAFVGKREHTGRASSITSCGPVRCGQKQSLRLLAVHFE